jgi:hypothetical protein
MPLWGWMSATPVPLVLSQVNRRRRSTRKLR